MQYEINVQQEAGKNVFVLETGNSSLKFEKLDAFPEFTGGQLQVVRNGDVFSESSPIREVGTFGSTTVFEGLHQLFENKARPHFIDVLDISLFEACDKIVIYYEPIAGTDFTFIDYLQMQERVRTAKVVSEATIGSP